MYLALLAFLLNSGLRRTMIYRKPRKPLNNYFASE